MPTSNTFTSLKPNTKETYTDKKKKRFSRTRKAMSELKASKNPKKFMEENIEQSLVGKKGIAV